MQAIHDAIHADAPGEEFAALPLPETMRACVIRKEDEHVFDGVPEEEQDPSRTLHLDEVP
ncbi:MAG: crotonyl-CoA carboxylase/reductase, partial [Nitriliruptor sp.]